MGSLKTISSEEYLKEYKSNSGRASKFVVIPFVGDLRHNKTQGLFELSVDHNMPHSVQVQRDGLLRLKVELNGMTQCTD